MNKGQYESVEFPAFMFSLAIMADVLRFTFAIFIITYGLSVVIGVAMSFVILVWGYIFVGPKMMKDQTARNIAIKKFATRHALNLIGGMIPGMDLFPWNSYTVWSLWRARCGK